MTQSQRIVRVAVPVPLHRQFDYAVPDGTAMPVEGARVAVPFAGRTLVGLVTALNPAASHPRVKPLKKVLDEENVLGDELMALGRWLSSYYLHPLGEVLSTLLPAAARRPEPLHIRRPEVWRLAVEQARFRRAPRQQALYDLFRQHGGLLTMEQVRAAGFERSHLRALAAKGLIGQVPQARVPAQRPHVRGARPTLSEEQAAVLGTLRELDGYAPVLLDGITGSGKTEVYLRYMETVLEQGRQVLVLVPEIALTPQTVARFEARFGEAAVLHSNLTDQARLQVWLKARSHEISIVIGTRSAVLVPFADLGLIVVDEEHDASFKQTDGLRYSARDVAVKRARDLDIPLILGTATPSFETLHNAKRGRYRHLKLTRRAGGASSPAFRILDIRGHSLSGGLSQPLLNAIGQHLDAGGQALVFLNRRGFAPTLLCGHCRWRAGCPGCDWPMTLHRSPPLLICHHCGRRESAPEVCPECGHSTLVAVGAGTQRCEAELTERFPEVPVYRIDRDTTRSQRRLEAHLATIAEGRPAILVGTQMLAKGHHFPDVTLVAVVNADAGFMSPDFRAPERTAQLIIQVAGRAGRAERPGVVYVQSYQPDSPLLTALVEQGYAAFAERELQSRAAAELPPCSAMALIRAEAREAETAQRWLRGIREQLHGGVQTFGPAPALMPRVADRLRYQLMITAPERRTLHDALAILKQLDETPRGVRWSVDVDPYDSF